MISRKDATEGYYISLHEAGPRLSVSSVLVEHKTDELRFLCEPVVLQTKCGSVHKEVSETV